jgi:hypothetical protein
MMPLIVLEEAWYPFLMKLFPLHIFCFVEWSSQQRFTSRCSARYACRLSSAPRLKPSAKSTPRRGIPRTTLASASPTSRNSAGGICSLREGICSNQRAPSCPDPLVLPHYYVCKQLVAVCIVGLNFGLLLLAAAAAPVVCPIICNHPVSACSAIINSVWIVLHACKPFNLCFFGFVYMCNLRKFGIMRSLLSSVSASIKLDVVVLYTSWGNFGENINCLPL